MKKTSIFLIIMAVLILMVFGCQTVPEVKTQPGADIEKETTPAESPESQKQAEQPKEELSQAVKELVAKAEAVESYSYLYQTKLENINIYIRGSKVKHKFSKIITAPTIEFDTIYFDTEKKTAVGYCEGDGCDYKLKNVAFNVDYNKYKRPTALDYMKALTSGDVTGSSTLDGYEMKIIEYTKPNGQKVKLWAGSRYGLPAKQETWDKDERIDVILFTGFVYGVREKDVNPLT